MYTPDLLTMTDGTPVTSSAQWEARRGELLNILAREQYGAFLPPSTASAQVMAPPMPACAGHAMQETLEVRFDTPAGEFAFPLRFLYPADGQVHPLFLLLNFRPLIPDIYCPAEEILDNGFVASPYLSTISSLVVLNGVMPSTEHLSFSKGASKILLSPFLDSL